MRRYILFFMATICAPMPLHADEESTYNTFSYTNRVDQYQNPYVEPRATLAGCQKTPQDSAKEQFQASCNALNRSQRFSCPSYSLQNINAQLFASWSATDFARAAEYAMDQARRSGSCQYDVEQHILSQYNLYRIPAFREHIKTFSGYRTHIKALRDRLVAQKGRGYRILRALGLLDPNYVYKLDLAQKLYAEVIAAEKKEKTLKQQQLQAELVSKRQQWLEAKQQALQAQQAVRNQQESVRTTFESQRDELNQLSDEWLCLQDIYQEHDLCDDGRYERRRQALHNVTNDVCSYETKSYMVSPDASQLIGNTGNDVELYRTCYGNQMQQVIHQECIDGIERLVCLPETSVVYPYKESIAHCFDAAREYNQAGAVDKATAVTDFCWTLLDYGKAITQAAVEGVVGGVRDMLEHPVETVLCAVACEYVLAYQLSKILYNVADIGITYAFDAERGKQQWDEYVAPVTQLIDAISNKELSLRDGLKGATQFAVQWKTQAKLLGGLNKFCKTAKTKALEFAKNNPLVSPKQYMTTPEGILLQSTHNIQPPPASGSSFKYELSSKFFIANEREIAELTKTAQTALQPSQEVLQVFSRESLNTPEKFLKHIFAAELKERKLPNGAVKKSLAGFHHYIPEHLEEMNIELLNPRTCERTGLIIADVLCDGHLEAKKTFFPVVWSREQVIAKLGEAVRNPIKDPKIEGTRGVLFGRTSEGIVIRTIIDIKSGDYITAYPDSFENGLF